MGAMVGYEFLSSESPVSGRVESERRSLEGVRTRFQESIDDLITETQKIKNSYSDWDNRSKLQADRRHLAIKRLTNKRVSSQNKKADERFASWSDNIQNLEETYKDLLRLKKPAEYWNKAAKKYAAQGVIFFLLLVLVTICGIVWFADFFVAWLLGQNLPFNFSSIQGIVLYGSIAAIYAYLVRVISRLTFSSFHLMRDANEREQLTYLYLSLSNETEVDQKSREIVLQALFSRSETGLLAQEHGPTMPGVADAIRRAVSK